VLVGSGVYETGGVNGWPPGSTLTSRVAIWKAVTVRSANDDPANTIIKGAWDPATNGPAAVRCVYMVTGSSLIGFTLTNGATMTGDRNDGYAAGVYSQSRGTVISNCVVTGNAGDFVAGVLSGTLYDCTITGNRNGSGYGGGAQESTLYNCRLTGNSSHRMGGGAYGATLYSCLVDGNTAREPDSAGRGGGVALCTAYNCTVVGNRTNMDSWAGAGSWNCSLYNCIVLFNKTVRNEISDIGGGGGMVNSYTCSSWLYAGEGNIYADAKFMANPTGSGASYVAGDYRLQVDSPCINTGTNLAWMAGARDLAGHRRVSPDDGRVDMGAYEVVFSAGTVVIVR